MTLFFIIFNFLDVLIGHSVLFTNSMVGLRFFCFGQLHDQCYEYPTCA